MGIRCKTRKVVSNNLSSGGPSLDPCSIEQYVAKKDPFRVAPTSKTPVPWPHDNRSPRFMPRYDVFDHALEDRTREALKKFGIKPNSTSIHKLTQRGFPIAEEYTQEAADYVNKIINDAATKAGTTMGVELLNRSKTYSDISSPINPGTFVHRSFLKIEPVAEEEVRKCCSGLWTSIAYHICHNKFTTFMATDALAPIPGYVEPVRRPTVVVFIALGFLAHWDEIEVQICDAIDAVPFEEDVETALEILPGFNVPPSMRSAKYPVTTSRHPRYESPITLVPSLGASISPQLGDADS